MAIAKLKKAKMTKSSIYQQQRKQLTNYAYDKVAKIQIAVAGPGSGAVTASRGGKYSISPRNSKLVPAIKSKSVSKKRFVGIRPLRRRKK